MEEVFEELLFEVLRQQILLFSPDTRSGHIMMNNANLAIDTIFRLLILCKDKLNINTPLVNDIFIHDNDVDYIYTPYMTNKMSPIQYVQENGVYKLYNLSKYLGGERDEYMIWETFLKNKYPEKYRYSLNKAIYNHKENTKDGVKTKCEFLTTMGISQMRLMKLTKYKCKLYVLKCLQLNGYRVIDKDTNKPSVINITFKELYNTIESECGRILDIAGECSEEIFSDLIKSYIKIIPFMKFEIYFSMDEHLWISYDDIQIHKLSRYFNKISKLKFIIL